MAKLRLFSFLLFLFIFSGCQWNRATPGLGSWVPGYCGAVPADLASTGFTSDAEVDAFMKENKIVLVNDVPRTQIYQAVYEFRFQIPKVANDFLVRKGVELRLVNGTSVFDDPKFAKNFDVSKREPTHFESIAVGIAYTSAATVRSAFAGLVANAIAHERGHNIDQNMAKSGEWFHYGESKEWAEAMAEPGLKNALHKLCGAYCDSPVEAFAETFSIYSGCPASRALLNDAPKAVAIMESVLKDVGEEMSKAAPPTKPSMNWWNFGVGD